MTHSDLIAALGGGAAVARILKLSQPSVHRWITNDRIPDDKLVLLAPKLEAEGIATRRELFPLRFAEIWPELAPKKRAVRVAK